MARINPIFLRKRREASGWSLEDLARRSGIDKTAIHRIESGKTKRSNNGNTIAQLAKALKVEPDDLTAADAEAISPLDAILPKAKLKMQISAESNNALTLVAMRYEVSPSDIVEFAPLLFHLAASESLQLRWKRLAELREARDAVSNLGGNFRHLAGRLVSDATADELDWLEEKSIEARDLRGDTIDEANTLIDVRSESYDSEQQNPFVEHLRARLAAVQPEKGDDAIEGWGTYSSPSYALCRAEALALFGGDEEAADDAVAGRLNLTDLLKATHTLEERVSWAAKAREERRARVGDLFNSMGLGDLS